MEASRVDCWQEGDSKVGVFGGCDNSMGGDCGGRWCSSGGGLRMGQLWWGCDGGGKGGVHCDGVLVVFIIGVAIIFMVIMAATTMVTVVVVGMEKMVKVR